MKNIEDYEFGKIVIDGKTYTADVIILPDKVLDNWWRKEGHRLSIEDLAALDDDKPEVLVIGTGHNGAMHVPHEVIDDLIGRNIQVVVHPTRTAVEKYNELCERRKTAAALHLTC